ncbi:DUF4142 domain-containing protein, partial [Xanthomonas sp. Kuri4-1]
GAAAAEATPAARTLLALPTAEVIRLGLISNRGMVVVAAAFGVLYQLVPRRTVSHFIESNGQQAYVYVSQLHPGTGATAAVKGDAQALGVLAALDENEIALAQQAIARKLGGTTEDFAREMVTQHQADLDKVRALGVADSANAQALRAKGKAALDALAQENDENSYRNAFMATMNSDHADALKIVDAELMPAATGEAARQHLTQARKLIAEHYERAQAVVSSR